MPQAKSLPNTIGAAQVPFVNLWLGSNFMQKKSGTWGAAWDWCLSGHFVMDQAQNLGYEKISGKNRLTRVKYLLYFEQSHWAVN